jgi:mRNA interferase RelE/StbE
VRLYRLVIGREAERNLRLLPQTIARRVVNRIQNLPAEPRPRGAIKLVGRQQDYRIRVGRYRIVYAVDDSAREVRIHFVQHRKDAYRRNT